MGLGVGRWSMGSGPFGPGNLAGLEDEFRGSSDMNFERVPLAGFERVLGVVDFEGSRLDEFEGVLGSWNRKGPLDECPRVPV